MEEKCTKARMTVLPEKNLLIYKSPKTAKKTQMCMADFWTQREREREG